MNARRLLRILSVLAAVMALMLGGLTAWLLYSDGGRDWALDQISAHLPSGAGWRVGDASGHLGGTLVLRGVHYQNDSQTLDVQRLQLRCAPWSLLWRTLDIRQLIVEEAIVRRTTTEAAPKASADFQMPRLALPLTIAVTDFRVRGLSVIQDQVPVWRVDRADAAGVAANGQLRITRLRLDSDRGSVTMSGEYQPRQRFSTKLDAQAILRLSPTLAPVTARLSLRGDAGAMQLHWQSAAPGLLQVDAELRDGDRAQPHWRVLASSEGLSPAAFGFADSARILGKLRAEGVGGNVSLQGSVQRGDQAIVIAPSTLRLGDGVIELAPLTLQLPIGAVHAQGQVIWRGADAGMDVRLASDGLHLVPGEAGHEAVTATGDVRVLGPLDDWRAHGQGRLVRGAAVATIQLQAKGDRRHADLETLRLDADGGGHFHGDGALAWSPQLDGHVQARLTKFDPGFIFPDYPGALDGELSLQVRRSEDLGWIGQANLTGIGGRWRGRPVGGEAMLNWDGQSGTGDLRLQIGQSRVEAQARLDQQVAVRARFAPLDLADVMAGIQGRVQGELRLSGARAHPGVGVDLRGHALQWHALRTDDVHVHGTFSDGGPIGALALDAKGAAVAGVSLERLTVTVNGRLRDWQGRLDAQGDPGRLQLQLDAAQVADGWRGTLRRAHVDPVAGVAWTLRAPAVYRWPAAASLPELNKACLESAGSDASLCLDASADGLHAQGHDLPLAWLQPWIDERQSGLEAVGNADLALRVQRAAGGNWNGDLDLTSAAGGLRLAEAQPTRDLLAYQSLAMRGTVRDSRVALTLQANLAGQGWLRGQANSALAADAAVAGELNFELRDLAWLELYSVDLAQPSGDLTGTLRLAGRLDAPQWSGDAQLQRFRAELPALNSTLSDGEVRLRADAAGVVGVEGNVRAGTGTLRLTGDIDPARASGPMHLTLRGDNLRVADTPDLELNLSPDLQLDYGDGLLRVRGAVAVPRARVNLERLDSGISASSDVVVLDPRPGSARASSQVDTEVMVELGDDVRLHGFGLDGRLGGSLRVRDLPGRAAVANGSLEVSGSYLAYGQQLRVTQGRLNYSNVPFDDPALDIRAQREIGDVTVGVRVRGRAQAPETSVYSSPSMEPTEALAWLALGRPLSSASGSETRAISASAVALSAGSNLLAQQLGTRLGLDEAGVADSRVLGGAALTIGKQLSPKLFVSYGLSLLGTGQVITLKYLVRRGLDVSLESSAETTAAVHWRKEK